MITFFNAEHEVTAQTSPITGMKCCGLELFAKSFIIMVLTPLQEMRVRADRGHNFLMMGLRSLQGKSISVRSLHLTSRKTEQFEEFGLDPLHHHTDYVATFHVLFSIYFHSRDLAVVCLNTNPTQSPTVI